MTSALPNKPLPQGWRWVRLGDICEVIRGVTFQKWQTQLTKAELYIPCLRAGNIADSLLIHTNLLYVASEVVSREQRLQYGDIVMCTSSGSPAVVGKTAVLATDWEGTVGAFCAIIRPHSETVGQLLRYWFRSQAFMKWRDGQARGANIQNLRTSEISNLPVPLPPIDEQRRIVARLNEQMAIADRARRATERMVEAIHALPSAILRAVLPDQDQHLPEGWRWARLGDVCEAIRGVTFKAGQAVILPRQGFVACVTTSAVQAYCDWETRRYIPNECIKSSSQMLRPGDIIVSTANSKSLVGKSCLVSDLPEDCAFGAFVTVIRHTHNVTPEWLLGVLHQEKAKHYFYEASSNTTNISNLRVSDLLGYPIPLPPLDEQRRIVARIDEQMAAAELARRAAEGQAEAAAAVPAALLRSAFAGAL